MSDFPSAIAARLPQGIAPLPAQSAKPLVFGDPRSRELQRFLERVAPSEAPVLIRGEIGTGKELVARHVHQLSGRSGPFVAVNCGAINEQLAEAELFGHEQGAFTGASGMREGWFEAANGGTLFLDEIGDLPLPLQVKLLRVLQEREIVRVGSRKPLPVDIRLVAATHADLDQAVQAARFRLDLLYRLNVAQLLLPPLRDRGGDILPLAHHFMRVYGQRLGLRHPALSAAACEALQRYRWPGNIRELENVIHFALLMAPDSEIRPEHLKLSGDVAASRVGSAREPEPTELIVQGLHSLFDRSHKQIFTGLEKLLVDEAYSYCQNNQVRAASLLGISRNVMRTLLKRHGHLVSGAAGDDGFDKPDDAPAAAAADVEAR